MKSYRWIILSIAGCLLLAAGAYLWATRMIDSLYAYRSPLHSLAPSPGKPLGQPSTRRVVFVLIDALRLDTSLDSKTMPFLNELRKQGASAVMHSQPPSFSQPGYSVLLTGAWPDINDGPAANLDYPDIPTFTQDDLFSGAHRAGLKTAVSGFNWFKKLIPQTSVDASFYTSGEDQTADRAVVAAALPWLDSSAYQLILIHLDQVDYAGHHEGGSQSHNWEAAAKRSDDLLREIAAQLNLSQDTLFISSDHGQIDRGGHGGQEPITLLEPFVLVGAGIQPGDYGDVNMVDVAPTLAALLGTNLPASSQGHVLTEMLSLNPGVFNAIHQAEEAQQRQLVRAYQAAIARPALLRPELTDPVLAYQSILNAARSARLSAERLPRFLLAGFLALLPAAILAIKWMRDKAIRTTLAWLLAGGLLYIFLFNFRYLILDRRTYSFSTLTSAAETILYIAGAAALALGISWFVLAAALNYKHQRPSRVGKNTLGLVLMILYLLSLPVLWSFALNGMLVNWTLPDFASEFLALIHLIEILMVGILGLLFTGLAAFLARFNNLKRNPELQLADREA